MHTETSILALSLVSAASMLIGATFIGSAAASERNTQISVETDPSTFSLGGYAAHLRISPTGMPHWVFGAGAYSLTFPDAMVDLNKNNRKEGWDVQLRQGLGLFGEYYFDPSNQGWFVGGQLAHHAFRIENANLVSGNQEFSNVLLMAHAGYRWFPLNNGFYVQPWAGIGYTRKIGGSTTLGSDAYDIAAVMPFATMHVGYRF